MRCVFLSVVLSILSVLVQAEPKPQIARNYAKLPLSFESNRGQAAQDVDFVAHGQGFTMSLSAGQAWFSIPDASAALRLSIIGAARVPAEASDLNPGHVNYIRGTDERQWLRNIPTYGRVSYSSVLPGVDLHFYGNQQQLEYDFVFAPYAAPGSLRLKVEGAEKVSLAEDGSLMVRVGGHDFRWGAPSSYQVVDGVRRRVKSSYILRASNEFAFEVGVYDGTRPLVIDPVLGYSTYLGGHGQDTVSDIALDSQGHAFVTGQAGSVSFPTTPGSYRPTSPNGDEGFVSKLSIDGSRLLYSTFLQAAEPQGIAVDSAGNAYLTGWVSRDFPFPTKNAYRSTPDGGTDAFLMKLNSSGSDLVYSTYFGGSGDDSGTKIAVFDSTPYILGSTWSSNLPLQSAMQTSSSGLPDAFVTRFSADGQSLTFSTYLGGSEAEFPADIAVDADGTAYVTGETNSVDFPSTEHIGSVDADGMAFVTKISSSDNREYSTTINGTAGAQSHWFDPKGIAVDGSGIAYLAGNGGPGFPTTTGALNTTTQCSAADGCAIRVVKLKAAGDSLIYSAAFGGSTQDLASDISVDSAGHAFVTGWTSSNNFPRVGALQSQLNRGTSPGCRDPDGSILLCNDAFVSELNIAGSALLFSTYLGGSDRDWGGALIWWNGRLFVTGSTHSADFPSTANALQPTLSGSVDAWITRIDLGASSCAPQSTPGVKICSPTNGSTVPAGKVRIQAVTTSSSPVTSTKFYIDGTAKFSTSSASVDFSTTLTVKGQRRLSVKSWTSSGTVLSKTIYFTLQ